MKANERKCKEANGANNTANQLHEAKSSGQPAGQPDAQLYGQLALRSEYFKNEK